MSESIRARVECAGCYWRALLREQRGVTLIELMVVIGMLGIVFTAAFFFYSTTLARTKDTEQRRNTLADQRVAVERVARDIRESVAVVLPAAGASSDVLELTVIDGLGGQSTVVFDCTAGSSCSRAVDGGSPTVLIEGLDSPTTPVFTVGSLSDYVLMRIEATPPDRTRPIVLSRGVALRNCVQDVEAEDCRA